MYYQEEKQYLDWKATYAPKAAYNYKFWLDRFLSITNKKVSDVGVGDIIEFRRWLDNKYQPKSIELAMIVISNYFKFWRLQGVQCISPELIKVPKTVANSHQPISFEEYTSMLSFIKIKNFWDLQKIVLFRLLFETGMRVSELTDLNISDINPINMHAIIRTKKTKRMRKIFWSVETHIFIKEFLRERKNINGTPALFIGRIGGGVSRRLTTRSVQRYIKDLSSKAKIEKKITPHSFRHGKAHRVLDLGGNPKDVQAILGHCNPASSFTYLQWNDHEFEERAKLFI